MNLYENSWLYDLVHEKPPDSQQLLFYQKQIEKFGEPVLELACGSGNYLVTLSTNDIDISGLDISKEMLNAAGKRAARQNIETKLFSGDMRDFDLKHTFNLVFIAGNSLQHLNTHAEVGKTFASVKRHLKPGGKFIVEVFNPSLPLLCRDPHKRYFVGEYRTPEGWIVITENVFYDVATQVNHIQWHYRNQFEKEEHSVSFSMRQYFPAEFDSLFANNGFRILNKYGDFDESAFLSSSPRQIVACESA